MSTIRKLADLHTNNAAYPVIQRDQVIDAAVLDLFDFKSAYVFPNQASPIGAQIFNSLVMGGGTASTTVAANATPPTTGGANNIGYSSRGGLMFKGDKSRLVLPASFGFGSAVTNFAVGFWYRNEPITAVASQTYTTTVASFDVGITGTTGHQWRLQLAYSAGAVGNLSFDVNNQGTGFQAANSPTDFDVIHQVVLEFVAANSLMFARLYVDGALKETSRTWAFTPPLDVAAGAVPGVGALGGNSYGPVIELYRAWAYNPANSSRSIAAFVAQEWSLYKTRFN